MSMPPSRQNPNSSLPNRMSDAISIPEFNERMAKIENQAEELAKKANRIYKVQHPEDKLDTGMFDKKDFLNGTELVIPQQAQELFDLDDAMRLAKSRENEQKIKQEITEKFEGKEQEQEQKEETSVEDLQRQLGIAPKKKEKFDINNAKKHPVLSKLKEKFGIKNEENAYITRVINDVEIIFEFPTAMTTNFAMAIAQTESVGTLDFANAYELARCSLSIVSMEGKPVSELFADLPQFTYKNIPSKVRKLCGFEVMQFLQEMPQDQLENILSFYRTEIGFGDLVGNEKDVVELECTNCGATRTVFIDGEGNYDIKFCDRCGTKLIPTNTSKSDENVPLA